MESTKNSDARQLPPILQKSNGDWGVKFDTVTRAEREKSRLSDAFCALGERNSRGMKNDDERSEFVNFNSAKEMEDDGKKWTLQEAGEMTNKAPEFG